MKVKISISEAELNGEFEITLNENEPDAAVDATFVHQLVNLTRLIPAIKRLKPGSLNIANVAWSAMTLGVWELEKMLLRERAKSYRNALLPYLKGDE